MAIDNHNSDLLSTSEAALALGVSAPLVRACRQGGLLDGDSRQVTRASLEDLNRKVDKILGTRSQAIISLLRQK